jgi:hypothetical protein
MSASDNNPLSANQQAMLDLALACDLKVSDPSQQALIKARHQGIKTQGAAKSYIKEVEDKIHSRRQVKTLPSKRGPAPAPNSVAGGTPPTGQPSP